MSKLKKVFFVLLVLCFSELFCASAFCMTMEEFVNDSRFCDGVLWGNENHARYEIQGVWPGEDVLLIVKNLYMSVGDMNIIDHNWEFHIVRVSIKMKFELVM